MDIDHAVSTAGSRVVPGIDSIRAGAIVAYHANIQRLKAQLDGTPMSPQGRRATEAVVRLYSARIDALSREVA
jgi:hypothetical protein